MDNKIVKVIFKEGWETMYNTDLTQGDYGLVLQIEGITLPDGNVEVHFSLTEHNGEAPISIGTVKDNVITVDIPDFILQKKDVYTDSYQAYAWIYVTDGESGRTIRKIVFTIDTRAEPTTNVPEDKKDPFLQEVRQVMAETKEVAQSVRDDADNGKFSGIPGPPGKDGKNGEDGKDGDDGEDGKSAYDYAVEGGFKGTEQEFIDLMAQAGHVDLTGYVTKEQHEAALLKAMIKTTTDKAPHHHITDSANYRVLDFGMEGITKQRTTSGKNRLKLIGRVVSTDSNVSNDSVRVCTGNYIFVGMNPANYKDAVTVNSYSLTENSLTTNNKYGDCGIGLDMKIKSNTYYVYSCKQMTTGYTVSVCFYDVDGKFINYTPNVHSSKSFLTPTNATWAIIVFHPSTTGTDVTYNDIQIEEGTVATDYEPYTGGMPSPNPDYEQPITLAGVLNEETGRYEIGCTISDENEKNSQPFTLTSDRPLTKWDKLVKRDGVYGWSIWSKYYENHIVTLSDWISVANTGMWDRFYINAFKSFVGANGKCNIFRWRGQSGNQENYVCGFMFSDALIVYLPKGELGIPDGASVSVSENKVVEYMSDKPLTICFETAKEVKFIPLPNEEQTLLKNLETYYGVTNVYNEQGCPISITYVNDPKLYVDNKLLEIQQAII